MPEPLYDEPPLALEGVVELLGLFSAALDEGHLTGEPWGNADMVELIEPAYVCVMLDERF